MKKVFYLVVLFSLSLFAQKKVNEKGDSQKSKFGVKGGVNFSITKNYGNEAKSTYAFGYQIGGTYQLPLSDKINFKPELLLQSISRKFDKTEYGVRDESLKTAIYIQVPLNFNYHFTDKFAIELGPNVAYLINAKSTFKSTAFFNGAENSSSYTVTNTSNLKRFVFGANLGLNYKVSEPVSIGSRYTVFIQEQQRYKDTLNNSVFALSFEYSF